jgi:hypothetical protein
MPPKPIKNLKGYDIEKLLDLLLSNDKSSWALAYGIIADSPQAKRELLLQALCKIIAPIIKAVFELRNPPFATEFCKTDTTDTTVASRILWGGLGLRLHFYRENNKETCQLFLYQTEGAAVRGLPIARTHVVATQPADFNNLPASEKEAWLRSCFYKKDSFNQRFKDMPIDIWEQEFDLIFNKEIAAQ